MSYYQRPAEKSEGASYKELAAIAVKEHPSLYRTYFKPDGSAYIPDSLEAPKSTEKHCLSCKKLFPRGKRTGYAWAKVKYCSNACSPHRSLKTIMK